MTVFENRLELNCILLFHLLSSPVTYVLQKFKNFYFLKDPEGGQLEERAFPSHSPIKIFFQCFAQAFP